MKKTGPEIAQFLADLEARSQSWLARLEVCGWNIWPWYRLEIIQRLMRDDFLELEGGRASAPHKVNQEQNREYTLRSVSQFVRLALTGGARNKVFVRTTSCSRRIVIDGKHYCAFFDQLVQDLGVEHFLVSEGRLFPHYVYDENVANPVEFYDDMMTPLARLFRPLAKLILLGKRSILEQAAAEIDREAAESIRNVAVGFVARYWAFLCLYSVLRPKSVLVTVGSGGREPEIAALKKLKIPCFEYQHGDMTASDLSYSYSRHVRLLKSRMPLPDRFFLFSQFQLQSLIEGGFWTPEELLVGGSPQIYLYERRGETPFVFDSKFVNVLVSPSVLTPIPQVLRQFLESYLLSGNRERYRFYVRPHPSEDRGPWHELAKRYPQQINITDKSLYSLLQGADIQLGVYTTCLQEGFYWRVPVFVVQGGLWELSKPLIKSGGARAIAMDHCGELEAFEVPLSEQTRYMAPYNLELIRNTIF